MRRIVLYATLTLAGLLCGCAGSIDRAQLDLCRRVVPALHPEGTEFREIRFAPAPRDTRGVRIDYAAVEPGDVSRAHVAICGFGEGSPVARQPELTSVQTDGETFGAARLLYLNRFWLAPGTGATALPPAVPELALPAAFAMQQAINALTLAAIYGLLATAYALIYGLVGRINLAFGDIAVIGAYGAIGGTAAVATLGGDSALVVLIVALLIAVPLSAQWSWVIGKIIVAPLHARNRTGQPILIATIAAAIVIQEFLRLSQGVRGRWMPPLFSDPIPLARAEHFVVTVTPLQAAIASVALGAAVALLVLMRRTRLGRQWRAFADDPMAASLFGVSPSRMLGATFILAGLNAGLAGWIAAVYYGNVSFAMGTLLSLKALLAAIIGGVGRVEGALLGGLLLGLVEAGWSAYFDTGLRDIVVFSLLIVMFVLRPGGLFGDAGPRPREV